MSRASELAERLEATYDHNNTNEAAAELRRLERVNAELVEANEAQKNEWLAWDAKRKDLEREAARYEFLRAAFTAANFRPELELGLDPGTALIFWWPHDMAINSDLDGVIDAALTSATKETKE